MTEAMLKARVAETARVYQSALETARRIRHECDLRMTPIEAAPLLAEVADEVETRKTEMEAAWAMVYG